MTTVSDYDTGSVGKDDEDEDGSSEEDVSTGDVDVVVLRDALAPHQHTNHQGDCSSPQPPSLPAPGQPLKFKSVLQLQTNIPHAAIYIHLSPAPDSDTKYKPPAPPTL